MGIVYILTVIVLLVAFMLFKKSDEKQNFIKWLIIFAISLLGYNILIGMILGLLNITSHIWLLSIINLLVSVALGYKAVKNKDMQKYFVRPKDRNGSCYYEFYKGKWDKKHFGKKILFAYMTMIGMIAIL